MPAKEDKAAWKRVAAVIVSGAKWQFKDWPQKASKPLPVHRVHSSRQTPTLPPHAGGTDFHSPLGLVLGFAACAVLSVILPSPDPLMSAPLPMPLSLLPSTLLLSASPLLPLYSVSYYALPSVPSTSTHYHQSPLPLAPPQGAAEGDLSLVFNEVCGFFLYFSTDKVGRGG